MRRFYHTNSRSLVGAFVRSLISIVLVTGPGIAYSAGVLEEIIVTAQKREESIMDVPLSVTSLSAEFISDNNIFGVEDLAERVPNFQYSVTPFTPIVTIRGLGSSGANRGFESQVALFLDGIYGGRPTQFIAPMFDIENIEVIRGPQTVMFGKNATAGVVSIISAKPTDKFEGHIAGGYEIEDNGYWLEGVISGPITDSLSGRIAVRQIEADGFLQNVSTGKEDPETKSFVVRSIISWKPSDVLNADLKVELATLKSDGNAQEIVCYGPGFTTIGLPGLGSSECVADDRKSTGSDAGPLALGGHPAAVTSEIKTLNVAMNMDYHFGEHTFSLVAGYSSFFDQKTEEDPDRSSVGLVRYRLGDGDFEQYSIEARIASPTGNRFEYIFGGLYMDSNETEEQDLTIITPMFFLTDVIDLEQDVSTRSIFGQLTWNISDRFRASAQLRYTDEDKDYAAQVYRVISPPTDPTLEAIFTSTATPRSGLPLMSTYDLGRNESNLDYSFNMQFDISEDVMAYMAYSRASKTGGFDFFPRDNTPFPVPASAVEFEGELGKGIEGGIKAELLDHRLRVNFSIFYTEYDDMQQVVAILSRLGFETFNADAQTKGFEIDTLYAATENLTLGASVGYTDAEFTDFPNANCADFPSNGSCDPLLGQDVSGETLPFAPELTAVLFGEYRWNFFADDFSGVLRLDGNFTDDTQYQVDQDPNDLQESYWIMNVYLSIAPPTGKWNLSLQVKNLLDEDDINIFSTDTPFSGVIPAAGAHFRTLRPGRQVNVQVRWNF